MGRDFSGIVVTLDMLDNQGQQYRNMECGLKQLAIQSSRYLFTWLQWSLARPNSAFRDEVVVIDEMDDETGISVRKATLMELPAIHPNGHKWLPKENWLADFCKVEKQQGRKVLVYVRQTGARQSRPGDAAAASQWTESLHPGREH